MRSDDWAQLEQAASGGVPTVRTEPGGISLWFSTRGRISRSTYWLKFVLPLTGIQIVGAVLDAMLGFDDPDEMGPVGGLLFLLILWPVMVSLVKRLHDLDHPGWFVGAFYGGIFAGGGHCCHSDSGSWRCRIDTWNPASCSDTHGLLVWYQDILLSRNDRAESVRA